MCPIFVIKFSGVSDLQGVKVPVFPLTLLVIVTTVLRYRAACDKCINELIAVCSRYYGICAEDISTDVVKFSVWSAFEQSAV